MHVYYKLHQAWISCNVLVDSSSDDASDRSEPAVRARMANPVGCATTAGHAAAVVSTRSRAIPAFSFW